ncbi:hypothetical protein HY031_03400, partial [Candidatus Gottesmanbacteria bacterium]|nr:hypothetical protein [Candidatus Gottesmanbacteria bacterium]
AEIIKDGVTGFIVEPPLGHAEVANENLDPSSVSLADSGQTVNQAGSRSQSEAGQNFIRSPHGNKTRRAAPSLSDAAPSWIIKKRGVEGLVEAIGRIGEIDRAACRKHVEENFSVEKMVTGYEKIYKKILDR